MKYQKPTCDCGVALVFTSTFTFYNSYKIDKHGKVGRRVIQRSEDDFLDSSLCCSECGNVYSFYDDKNGRIVRGDLK